MALSRHSEPWPFPDNFILLFLVTIRAARVIEGRDRPHPSPNSEFIGNSLGHRYSKKYIEAMLVCTLQGSNGLSFQ